MRVLVTGGAGFVGSHVARALGRAGHAVELLDDLSTGHRSAASTLGLPLHEADVRDGARVEAVLHAGRFDAVIHAAAKALVAESVERPDLYEDVNVRGGRALLLAMRVAGCRRLVVSSSASVYGAPATGWIAEETPLHPVNPYGRTKAAFETDVADEAGAHGLRAVRLRYFNVAGADEAGDLPERHEPETHLVPRLIRAARSGEPFTVHGRDYEDSPDGTCVRDLVHVQDLARAHVLALAKIDDDDVAGHALNVGSGRGCSVSKAATVVEQVLGARVRLAFGPRRPGDPGRLVADVGKIEARLGWRAERDLVAIVRDAARPFDSGPPGLRSG